MSSQEDTGTERRSDALKNQILLEMRDMMDEHERVEAEKLEEIEKKLDKIYEIIAKIEGASTLAKTLFFIIGPLIAGAIWIKDHVRV